MTPPDPIRALPERPPKVGELVQVRSRRWLVEEVASSETPGASPVVALSCADDDAAGEELRVFWNYELDRRILEEEGWDRLAERGFDDPRRFAAFLHTLRWHCVTATDANLFQAPFRAGIRIDAYQMEPLRKALRLPRVNLFIADDTGLGKTIEAGLIARELLLRRKAKTIVVAAPPSVLEQWKGELEDRFGLVFEILDRAYLARMRRERGFGVNPWMTHSRFLVSHNLLIDAHYTDPMRAWLGTMRPGSLLILDEAHHAAPSSGGRYGIESKFTRAVRDLAGRFEHRLFLSATPHNGHSNSFSTLLELLDPYRFTRGVKVRGRKALEDVMVRRLKEDVRATQGGFPERRVERVVIDGLPADAPELALSRLLDEYRTTREQRHAGASGKVQAAAGLLVVGLQQRLLSSVEAFARSLAVHRRTVERRREQERAETAGGGEPVASTALRDASEPAGAPAAEGYGLFVAPPTADDERGEQEDELVEAEEKAQIEAITEAAESGPAAVPGAETAALWQREQRLLDRMQAIAERARHLPDAKTRRLLDWIRERMCPGLPPFGSRPGGPPPRWNARRVLIFTENREGTKRHLRAILEQAVEGTDRAGERIAVIDGLTRGARRKEIQRRFNTDPAADPLRILLATDAAREGLNFQAHCADLFHFDLPWNPGRIEQRNGRIDRKLQPAPEVRCHYFVLPQRVEDRVLEVLVRKTETIKRELGSLSKVIDDDVERRLRGGIRHRDADRLKREIEAADLGRGPPADHRRRARGGARPAGRPRGAGGTVPRPARAVPAVGRIRGGTVPRYVVLRAGAARCGAAGAKRRRRRERPLGDLDLPGSRPAGGRGPELGGDAGHAPSAAPERPEAGRLAPGGADPAGGLRGCGRARRRHGAPASGAAGRPAPPGAVPRAGFRAPRPVAGLPRAGAGLDSPRRASRPALPLRAPGGAPARGDRPAGGALGGAGAAERSAPGLRT